jgi:hypothetical protein
MWRLNIKNFAVAVSLIVGGLLGSGSSYAMSVVVGPQDDATGIDGLVVGTQTYNVTFQNIPYNTIFGCGSGNPPTCTTYPTFYSSADVLPSPNPTTAAVEAATALFTALNALGVTGITGITGEDEQNLLIPSGWTTTATAGDNAKVAYCLSTYAACFNSNARGSWIYDGGEYDDTTGSNPLGGQNDYAVFTAVTPLPAALPLFASALGGLGLLGWRRKQKA